MSSSPLPPSDFASTIMLQSYQQRNGSYFSSTIFSNNILGQSDKKIRNSVWIKFLSALMPSLVAILLIKFIIQRMQSYQLEEDDPNQDYKQELGLRKMLYKYQNQNEQLKNQIRALTQRLEGILDTKSQPKNATPGQPNPQEKFWNDQMQFYYRRIEQLNSEIKLSKELIDDDKEQQFILKSNFLKDKDHKLTALKIKLAKYQQEAQSSQNDQTLSKVSVLKKNSKGEEITEEQLEEQLSKELEETRRRIRELQKTRNSNLKHDLSKHRQMVNLSQRTRKISIEGPSNSKDHSLEERTSSPKKGGLWGMELTDQNYYKVKEELSQLQKQKSALLESIKIENVNLRQKVSELKNQYIDISTASMNNLNSLNLSNATRPKNTKQLAALSTPKRQPELNQSQTIVLPQIPLGNSAYQRKNDKNYVQKQIRVVEWSGIAKTKIKRISTGLSWNDESRKSPITGINLWMDKYLIGIQFLHTLGESTQHLHIEGEGKKIVPIQYRLSNGDYLENLVLVSNSGTDGKSSVPVNSIVGLELSSKNGRKDHFGQKIGAQGTQKFNFGIKGPQKPIYSVGSFTINSGTQMSCITRLGLAII